MFALRVCFTLHACEVIKACTALFEKCLNVVLLFMRSCRSFDPQPDRNAQNIRVLRYFVEDDHFEFLCLLDLCNFTGNVAVIFAGYGVFSDKKSSSWRRHANAPEQTSMASECAFNHTAPASSWTFFIGTLWTTLHAHRLLKDPVSLYFFVSGACLVAQEKKDCITHFIADRCQHHPSQACHLLH